MKISVITSTYNQLHLLKRALPHWQRQSIGPLGTDFEWILADDGSDDGVKPWAEANGLTYVSQPHEGYRLTKILNEAAKKAKGEYLVWVMADSYPRVDFLEEIMKVLTSTNIVNGTRLNIDEDDKIVSPDWRVQRMNNDDLIDGILNVTNARGWEFMTLNSMAMSKDLYNRLGGLYAGYDKGYGKMDWDIAAHAFYKDSQLIWTTKAVIYHLQHSDREDTEENTKTFEQRLVEFQRK